MLLLLLGLGQAATLAVLPLEQGAASEQYEGLGVPLAGMLTADLAQAPGLTLVERQRLDALLSEIELGESGYLDPATALRAGRGAGAELVVVGSYSVVEGQLLLEARVVSVESSTVVQAGHASGPVADFVAVEKDLVEALLEELDVELSSGARRKIVVQTPTEAWGALAAYGAGLAQEQAGQREQAVASYSQALMVDPDYDQARAALVELRAGLEQRQDARFEATVDAWHRVRLDILDAVPSETTRPQGFEHDSDSLAAFGLRLTALRSLDRDCDRYQELWAYAGHQGIPGDTSEAADEALIERTVELWVEHGLAEQAYLAERAAWKSSPSLWRSSVHYLFDLSGWLSDGAIQEGDGALGALQLCFPPEERAARIGDWVALVEQQGLEDHPFTRDGATLGQALRFHQAWASAAGGGLDVTLQRGLEALVEELSGDPKHARWADEQLARVLAAAEGWERRTVAMLGLDAELLWGVTRALAEADSALVVTEGATCQELLRQKQPMAQHRVEQRAAGEQDPDWLVQQLWSVVATPRDLGCLQGVPARFAGVDEVYAHVHSARDRARPEHLERCEAAIAGLIDRTDSAKISRSSDYAGMEAMQAGIALDAYYAELVTTLCVSE